MCPSGGRRTNDDGGHHVAHHCHNQPQEQRHQHLTGLPTREEAWSSSSYYGTKQHPDQYQLAMATEQAAGSSSSIETSSIGLDNLPGSPTSAAAALHDVVEQQSSLSQHLDLATPEQKDELIATLRKQLTSTAALARQHASTSNSLQLELDQLRDATSELNDENDELVNDMHDTIHENEELKERLEEMGTQCSRLRSRYAALRKEKEGLEEKLEMSREDTLDPNEIAELMDEIREQMKRKLKEACRDKVALERECRRLTREKEQLQEDMEQMAAEKRRVDMKLRDATSAAAEFKREVGRIGAEKQDLQRRLSDMVVAGNNNSEAEVSDTAAAVSVARAQHQRRASYSFQASSNTNQYEDDSDIGGAGSGYGSSNSLSAMASITRGPRGRGGRATPKEKSSLATVMSVRNVFSSWQQGGVEDNSQGDSSLLRRPANERLLSRAVSCANVVARSSSFESDRGTSHQEQGENQYPSIPSITRQQPRHRRPMKRASFADLSSMKHTQEQDPQQSQERPGPNRRRRSSFTGEDIVSLPYPQAQQPDATQHQHQHKQQPQLQQQDPPSRDGGVNGRPSMRRQRSKRLSWFSNVSETESVSSTTYDTAAIERAANAFGQQVRGENQKDVGADGEGVTGGQSPGGGGGSGPPRRRRSSLMLERRSSERRLSVTSGAAVPISSAGAVSLADSDTDDDFSDNEFSIHVPPGSRRGSGVEAGLIDNNEDGPLLVGFGPGGVEGGVEIGGVGMGDIGGDDGSDSDSDFDGYESLRL